ncbi:MAG: YkgJ family cysteine cluster protein [Verrucomicrobiota bacterium]|nr:YkgJ family cysteine cluster protein [Verrucomicrobiota bacterium]
MSEVYYQCQRCTNCCKWPGEVPITDDDVVQIARFMNLDIEEFVENFTTLREDRRGLTLTEKPNGECILLDGANCSINPVKPQQCRDFPNKWNFPGWRTMCEAIPVVINKE